MNDTKKELNQLIKEHRDQLTIEVYFNDRGNLVASDSNKEGFLSAMPWKIVESSGDLASNMPENNSQFDYAPDDATEVMILKKCKLNDDCELESIKDIEVKRGSLEEMVDNHFEVMNTLNELLG